MMWRLGGVEGGDEDEMWTLREDKDKEMWKR